VPMPGAGYVTQQTLPVMPVVVQAQIPMPALTPGRAVQPTPLVPAPVQRLPAQRQYLDFPNLFIAADGLTYQIVMYTAPVPSVGQTTTLKVGENELNYTVTTIRSPDAPIDDIFITQELPEIAIPGTQAPVSRAILMNGKWQIHGMQDEHTLTFRPPAPTEAPKTDA